MNSNIYIVAVSARTPLGFNAKTTAAAVRAGVDRITQHPAIVNRNGELFPAVVDSFIRPEVFGTCRMVELVLPPLNEICNELEVLCRFFSDVSLLIGVPELRPGWDEKDINQLKQAIQNQKFCFNFQSTVEMFPNGHSAGIIALKRAQELIKRGQAKICIVGGVDSYFNPITMEWLDDNRRIVGEDRRSAFIPGEGAGFVAVVNQEIASRFRDHSPALIRSIGLAREENRIYTDSICLGDGLTSAVREALMPLSMPEDMIEVVYCDINGERYRSEEWTFTILKTSWCFADPNGYELVSTYWGDVGAASAPLFMMLSFRSGQRGYAKHKRHLIWTSSNTGERGAVVLELSAPSEQGIVL